jgi:hypothetical protein
MSRCLIKHTTKNLSDYHIDFVWENAQDLEHVACLHRRTNYDFELLSVDSDETSRFPYRSLSFRTKRKILGFIPVSTFGFRKIIDKYLIYQIEYVPLLRTTTVLKSTLTQSPIDPSKTLMLDHVFVNLPNFLRPIARFIPAQLDRHTRLQCEEDEGFRSRRVELDSRGIKLPLSLFGKSKLDKAMAFLEGSDD